MNEPTETFDADRRNLINMRFEALKLVLEQTESFGCDTKLDMDTAIREAEKIADFLCRP